MKKKTHDNDKHKNDLLSCPFCGSDSINDKGYGIECRNCGVWIGKGSRVDRLGGYKKLWNTRSK